MQKINYTMEQLIPIVAELSRKYTGNDSTSIRYETAQQLMGAVIYCIRELYQSSGFNTRTGAIVSGTLPPEEAYRLGYDAVMSKTKAALVIYSEILSSFNDYGSIAYRDTIVKGIPEFFNHYDIDFCPQDTILTLDYPLLNPITGKEGIDMIYDYLLAVREEQEYLAGFPDEAVRSALRNYHFLGEELFINVREVFDLQMGNQ